MFRFRPDRLLATRALKAVALGFVLLYCGRYFSKQYNEMTTERLSVYDREGREIRTLDGMLSGWNCAFVNDEHLFIADPDSAWIVDVQTGATNARALDLGGYRRVPTIRI